MTILVTPFHAFYQLLQKTENYLKDLITRDENPENNWISTKKGKRYYHINCCLEKKRRSKISVEVKFRSKFDCRKGRSNEFVKLIFYHKTVIQDSWNSWIICGILLYNNLLSRNIFLIVLR